MIQVHGELDGIPYRVVLTGDKNDPVQGSKKVRALVQHAAATGHRVLAGPTGPRVKVDPADTASVLHLLAASGRVLTVVGNTPQPAPAAGVVL